jgi:hypothetical protein
MVEQEKEKCRWFMADAPVGAGIEMGKLARYFTIFSISPDTSNCNDYLFTH